jgi:signal transduction histidine kinase
MLAKPKLSIQLPPWLRSQLTADGAIALLTLTMIAVFHGIAAQDRLLLNLYYIGIVGAAYVLIKRRALALTVLVIFVASGTTLAQVYLTAGSGRGDPLLDPVVNIVSLCVLLFLIWQLGTEAYRFQVEQQRMRIRQVIEQKAVEIRAIALQRTSHEVRQPLSAIMAITETLLDGSIGDISSMQREFVQDIDDCAKHLMSLINDILDYAKAEAGMIQLVPEMVALPELIDQCITIVEPKAGENEVAVTAQVEPDASEIVADPLRLKQIVLNLLTNAVKFNEHGGVVKMHVRSEQDDVVISVRDTGRGIEPEQMENLFDPYYQAAYGDQGIGTGLGLSITKQLVQLHGGSISVESVVGSGSVFNIRLPRNQADPAENPPTDKPQDEDALIPLDPAWPGLENNTPCPVN